MYPLLPLLLLPLSHALPSPLAPYHNWNLTSTASPKTNLTTPLANLTTSLTKRPPAFLAPAALSIYDVATGAIHCLPPTGAGLVAKSPTNGGHDKTMLVTFRYTQQTAGKTCQLFLFLDAGAKVGGSRQVDVFTSLAPAPPSLDCPSTWPPGNQRDNQLGRMDVVVGGLAKWDWTSSSYLTRPGPCRKVGSVEAFELVGVGDEDYVRWTQAYGSGLRVGYW